MNAAQIAQAVACVKTRATLPAGTPGVELAPDDQPLKGNLGHGLYSVYLVDQGDTLQYVTMRDLKSVGMDAQRLHRVALANLAEIANRSLKLVSRGNVHMLTLDGHFEASLLLLDSLWEKSLAAYLPTNPVAVIPARDVLAFCDAGSREGALALSAMAKDIFASADHKLTDDLYLRRDGEWVAVHPPGPAA